MSDAHFGPYEIRDATDFCTHTFFSVQKNCGELPLQEALARELGQTYQLRLKPNDDPISCTLLRLKEEFLRKLISKIVPETNWGNAIKVVNELNAEIKQSVGMVLNPDGE
jgi:hypothetical protein